VPQIPSGTAVRVPRPSDHAPARAVRAQRPVSRAQHGPMISSPIRIKCRPEAASHAATRRDSARLACQTRAADQPGSSDDPPARVVSRRAQPPVAARRAAGSGQRSARGGEGGGRPPGAAVAQQSRQRHLDGVIPRGGQRHGCVDIAAGSRSVLLGNCYATLISARLA
jgi:hypothetical protein